MSKFCLGIDTSNYTTSAALFEGEDVVTNCRLPLPVKKGKIGLRQSDAVFEHIEQIDKVIFSALDNTSVKIDAVGVSNRPRNAENSYMPVFKVGVSVARSIAAVSNVPVFYFSHQQNHIAAALAGSKRTDLFGSPFLAFHISGGTTDLLYVDRDFNTTPVSTSLDLKAGQAVDRVGKMLGISFPAGAALDKTALSGISPKISRFALKGDNFSLSGLENRCRDLFERGEKPENIAAYLFTFIAELCRLLCGRARSVYGDLPVVFSGGVSGSVFIRNVLKDVGNTVFCEPQYASDNAVGVSFLASRKI